MKKYLLGILAIALAIGFSAFTTKPVKKATTNFTFGFQGDVSQQGEVPQHILWTDVRDISATCPGGGDEFACQIVVSDAYTHPDGNGFELLNRVGDNPQSESIITIPEVLSSASLYKVNAAQVSLYTVDNSDQ